MKEIKEKQIHCAFGKLRMGKDVKDWNVNGPILWYGITKSYREVKV